MKIVMCASEVVPFAKTGGLADVASALPLALEELGHQVIIVMPGYKTAHSPKFKIQKLKEDISYSTIGANIKVYFIEKEEYFNRDGLYGDKSGDFKDNLERFSYYARRTLELLKEINFSPDIIHAHDWQVALIPVYLNALYKDDKFYKKTKTALTIHNIGYQGIFAKAQFPKLGLDWGLFNMEMLEFYDKINFLKGGMVFCDIINTVSPTYSKEIQTAEFGFGLEGVLNKRRDALFGILNGLDYSIWNPENDEFISRKYSASGIEDKYKNKEDLQKVCNLPRDRDIPLFGIVSRLAEQKGFDILAEDINTICRMKLQLVILGTGNLKYHILLEEIVKKHPKVVSLHLKFDDPLAHKIYAGSDIFLMPSRYEPCGLGQLISFRYGTIPLVFKTGGLADTVNADNGFVFSHYNKDDLLKTIKKAMAAYKDKTKWQALARQAMGYNFSWTEAAKKYLKLYEKAKAK
ncbi:MAG: glycogen synthase GlgA [Candidatus Omnitrophica bacterium]|nr:glycogen synthase GlgA [Candidatus Omnitrophota bacterium]